MFPELTTERQIFLYIGSVGRVEGEMWTSVRPWCEAPQELSNDDIDQLLLEATDVGRFRFKTRVQTRVQTSVEAPGFSA